MNIHYLQHVPFEGLGCMESFFIEKGHNVSSTHLYRNDELPAADEIDSLIIMGGPMSIHDEDEYPWLKNEKDFIKRVMDSEKKVLGICLGAQLIADCLGAKVCQNPYREIGWYNIKKSDELSESIISDVFSHETEVFHWHGDTFDIPKGAKLIGSSHACKNQGFIIEDRIVALQFHIESTIESATLLVENCKDELDGSRYVQSGDEILAYSEKFKNINILMHNLLVSLEIL